ncbi:hypothetical protein OG218_01195 [Kineococcus sp. NBC_00420]|uniref:hypothetical protein n=1 Tax=Kineococcus sp. NBC_00420 TaxID=2903564 RepID=UPI002E200C51
MLKSLKSLAQASDEAWDVGKTALQMRTVQMRTVQMQMQMPMAGRIPPRPAINPRCIEATSSGGSDASPNGANPLTCTR